MPFQYNRAMAFIFFLIPNGECIFAHILSKRLDFGTGKTHNSFLYMDHSNSSTISQVYVLCEVILNGYRDSTLSSSIEILLFNENIHINCNKMSFYLIGSEFGPLCQFHPHAIHVIYLIIFFKYYWHKWS